MLKQWWRRVRPHLITGVGYFIGRTVGRTLKVRVIGFDKVLALPGGKILTGWHGKTFVAANFFKDRGFWTIISQSRDGEMQDKVFRRFGFNTIRGSSGRGGVKAAIEAIKELTQGATMAITPDGPRGPHRIAQGGVILMARKSGAPLIPTGVSAKRRWLMGSWDRYMVPKPFSKAIMIFGEPLYVPKNATDEELEDIRVKLQSEINRLEAEADIAMGHAPEDVPLA